MTATTVSLALHAMATRFELVLHGAPAHRLRAAGEEALAEIEQLENRLSLFRPGSDIAQVNARAAREPVRVAADVFALLQHAAKLTDQTGGAFDITIGPLMRYWGFRDGHDRVPDAQELAEVRACVGMHLVRLDENDCTVRFEREGVQVDLGAIGKGYALERGVELLREAGIDSALFHGGTSTVYGLGRPPEAAAWSIAIEAPDWHRKAKVSPAAVIDASGTAPTAADTEPFAVVSLQDEALSVSAIWGRYLEVEGKSYGHIIDPRTGEPATGGVLAAVASPSPTETDALSTALLTLGPAGHDRIARLRPHIRTLVAGDLAENRRVVSQGIAPANTSKA